ncbi:hypothetical protein PUN28_016615 [Cardiocondyla obscurior]|uniref:Uncharacterized protein n=1 Tax=Cardiocondyla obscurior TaxID=286306 RepID=A0AAW2EQL3_9HYME
MRNVMRFQYLAISFGRENHATMILGRRRTRKSRRARYRRHFELRLELCSTSGLGKSERHYERRMRKKRSKELEGRRDKCKRAIEMRKEERRRKREAETARSSCRGDCADVRGKVLSRDLPDLTILPSRASARRLCHGTV